MGGHNINQITLLHVMHRKILFKTIPSHEMVENEERKKHRMCLSLYKGKNIMDQLGDSHAVY